MPSFENSILKGIFVPFTIYIIAKIIKKIKVVRFVACVPDAMGRPV